MFAFPLRAKQSGLSLIELMVAMLLSLVLLAGVVAVFASSRKTYETTDQLSRIQENGRFALDVIVHDLRSGGFVGCNRRVALNSSVINTPAVLWNFARPIEGFQAQGAGWVPTLDTGTIVNADPAGDVIAIRLPRGDFQPVRMTLPMGSDTDAIQVDPAILALADLKAGQVIQVSDCNARSLVQVTGIAAGALAHAQVAANTTPPLNTPGNSTNSAGAAIELQGEVVAMNSVVYFLRASTSGTGLALWRRVAAADVAEELVEGVESMQFLFGEDTNNDAQIAVTEYKNANAVVDWNQVLSVRVALLVRALTEYGTDRDESAHQVLDVNVPAQNDRRLRQVFSTTVTVRNSAI